MKRKITRFLTAAAITGGLACPAWAEEVLDQPREEEDEVLLEFRSVVVLDGKNHYSLHDLANGTSFWVSDGNTHQGVEVVEFDPEENLLTVYYADDVRHLPLSAARVEELTAEDGSGATEGETRLERDAAREDWRQRYREFQSQWAEAAAVTPALRSLEGQSRELIEEYRQTRAARRAAERGSEERGILRAQERTMSEEIRLLAEYGALYASQTPQFAGQEIEPMQRQLRRMMFRGSPRQEEN
jgi:hypothetical protein